MHITVDSIANQEITGLLVSEGYRQIERIQNDLLVGYPSESLELKKSMISEPDGYRITNVHIRGLGRVNQIYPLLFRDYLRSNPSVRDT